MTAPATGHSPKPFVVLSKQRSGSTMLEVALNSHPEIRCLDELFHLQNTWSSSYRRFLGAKGQGPLGRARMFLYAGQYLDSVFSSEPSSEAIGFRLMYNHLRQNPHLLLLLRRRKVKLIHLVRRNVLKARVSSAVARERQVWRSDVDASDLKIVLPIEGLLEELRFRDREIRANRRRVSRYSPALEVCYEDVQAFPDREFARVLRFLGVNPDICLRTATSKQNPDRLQDVLENYAEVAALLRGTQHEVDLA